MKITIKNLGPFVNFGAAVGLTTGATMAVNRLRAATAADDSTKSSIAKAGAISLGLTIAGAGIGALLGTSTGALYKLAAKREDIVVTRDEPAVVVPAAEVPQQ